MRFHSATLGGVFGVASILGGTLGFNLLTLGLHFGTIGIHSGVFERFGVEPWVLFVVFGTGSNKMRKIKQMLEWMHPHRFRFSSKNKRCVSIVAVSILTQAPMLLDKGLSLIFGQLFNNSEISYRC